MITALHNLKISTASNCIPGKATGLWLMMATRSPRFSRASGLHSVVNYHFTSLDDAVSGAFSFALDNFAQSFTTICDEDYDIICDLFEPSIELDVAEALLEGKVDGELCAAIENLVTSHTMAGAKTLEAITQAKADAADRMIDFLDDEMQDMCVHIDPVTSRESPTYSLVELNELWASLGNIPVSSEVETRIDEEFLHFSAGTPTITIWHWFESQHEDFSVAKAMGIA